MKTGGGILKQDGKIAIAEACCCEGTPCCDCPWIQAYYDHFITTGEPARLRATFSGAAGGSLILLPQSDALGFCWRWQNDDFTGITSECDWWILAPQISLTCDQEDTSIEAMKLDITTDEFCGLVPTYGEFVEGSCGPPFYLKKRYVSSEGTPPGCDCPDGSEIFVEIESIDPGPP